MELNVQCLDHIATTVTIEEVSEELDKTERHAIQKNSWPQFTYAPHVSFSIAYAGDWILLKYFVHENAMRLVHYVDNSPVHEDSCVEFFIAFDGDNAHYNLEFNCAGTCLGGFGENFSQRKLIRQDLLQKIKRLTRIKRKNNNGNSINWELTLMIPPEVFAFHKINNLRDQRCRVNFYKCGDKLPQPHFLSWKEIEAAAPDFHLPQFFGEAYFK